MVIVKPETVLRWHRQGFRAYWRWKSWRRGGRPRIDRELRQLMRRTSRENPLRGAPRIHGELLMLGIEVSESTVGRYMIRIGRARSQGWKTFLRNHAAGIASIDLFVVRTISFKLLCGLVILRHWRRGLVRIAVTTNPTAEWIAGQLTKAFPWSEAPRYLIRDRDRVFGAAYTRRVHAMGIRDHPTAARSPWQNGHVERLIGFGPARMPRPRLGVRRSGSASRPQNLRRLLQQGPNPLVVRERRTQLPTHADRRCHSRKAGSRGTP
jgi:hypothetical protein